MADINDPSVADVQDPNVADEAIEYWGTPPNAEVNPETEQQPVEQAEAQPEGAGDEQQRYQYWQSRYDQKASEFDTMSKKLAEYEKVAPIAEYIQENPDILKGVAKSLSGDTPEVPSQEKSMELPKKPTRPTKPTNYDATEAYMDVDSASYKYRAELDEYRDGMIDYQENREQQRIQQLQAEQQKVQQRQAEYQQQQAVSDMRYRLVNEYGYEQGKADEFLNFYSSPDSVTLENLVQLDKLRQAPTPEQVATKQKVQAMQNAKERMKVPTPTAVQTGNAEPQYSEQDLFNMGLMLNKK